MDILASIFAYMTCVAGIIGAFAISIFVLFSAPDHPDVPRQESTLATKHTAAALNTAKVKPSQTATATKRAVPSQTASNGGVPVALPAAEKRKPSRQVSAAQLRHLARQERNKHFAYQQDPDFEARFLGHAD
jgi:hypothetical protein